MKRLLTTLMFLSAIILAGQAQKLKPYIGAQLNISDFDMAKSLVDEKMATSGLTLVGQYKPAKDYGRWVFVYTTPELQSTVKKYGGIRGFGLTQRIAITKEDDKIILSATNPHYWGAAYFQEDYSKEIGVFDDLNNKIEALFTNLGLAESFEFGSKEGLEVDDLIDYQYMFGMPYFKDVVELGEYSSFETINSNIKKGLRVLMDETKLVYSVELSEQKMALYGIGLFGDEGEQIFLPIIDFLKPKNTCFLPYEILVLNNKVYMLHGRFRIALSFPDLTMGTFSKIMSTPGDIEEAMLQILMQ
jgi:hypothetical protein